jgi:hypothetical protein
MTNCLCSSGCAPITSSFSELTTDRLSGPVPPSVYGRPARRDAVRIFSAIISL